MGEPTQSEPTIGGGNSISEGIMDIVVPALEQLDAQIKETRKSQIYLGENVQKLSEFLKEILDEKQMPFDLGDLVRKLEDSIKRINNVQTRVQAMNDRMTNLQRQIARETFRQKQGDRDPPNNPVQAQHSTESGEVYANTVTEETLVQTNK